MYYRLGLTMYYYCLWYDKLWGPSQRVVTLFLPLRGTKGYILANHNLISVRHRKYRLIILEYLHLLSCSSTLDLLFFSGSGASTLARELEPPRPWLDVGAN